MAESILCLQVVSLVVAAISNTYDRQEVMSFSDVPFHIDYNTVLIKTPEQQTDFIFIKPFDSTVLCCLFAAVLLMTLANIIFQYVSPVANKQQNSNKRVESNLSLLSIGGNVIWNNYGSLVGQGMYVSL